MLRFYEVPRRISLGFAHSAAAAGYRRRGGARSVDLLRATFVFPEGLRAYAGLRVSGRALLAGGWLARLAWLGLAWPGLVWLAGWLAGWLGLLAGGRLAGGRARGLQNTNMYDEKRELNVFHRESKAELAGWSQDRLGTNLRNRKSLTEHA